MVTLVVNVLLVLLSQNNYCENDTSGLIDKYLTLSVELNQGTVRLNGELSLTIVFKNITDSCISFYPKALLSIVRPSGGFEFDSYFLNETTDVRQPYKIRPGASYKETYQVPVKPPVFRKGENFLHLYYICKEQKGKLKIYNKLYGSLSSEEFVISVE